MDYYSPPNDCFLSGSGVIDWDNAPGDVRSSPHGQNPSCDSAPVRSPSRVDLDMDNLFALTEVDEQVPSSHIPEADLGYGALCDSLSLAPQEIPPCTNPDSMKSKLPAPGQVPFCLPSWDIGIEDTCFFSSLSYTHPQPALSYVNLTSPPAGGKGSWLEQKLVDNVIETLQSLANYRLASTLVANQTIGFDFENCTKIEALPLAKEDTKLTVPDVSAPFQPTPCQPTPRTLPVLPPPEHLVPYSGQQSKLLSEAFTEGSCHPSVALRSLLDCVIRSEFIANQVAEPHLTDEYSIYILAQIVNLPQCPPIDFNASKRSLFTLFVDKPLYRCLMCNMRKSSLPRALGCVRSHLGHRPFRCSGCQSCNPIDGYAKFWTPALLRDHIDGREKKKKCMACGLGLRRGGMRRHWNAMHKGTPFPFHENPRYRKSVTTRSQSMESTPEGMDELLDSLVGHNRGSDHLV